MWQRIQAQVPAILADRKQAAAVTGAYHVHELQDLQQQSMRQALELCCCCQKFALCTAASIGDVLQANTETLLDHQSNELCCVALKQHSHACAGGMAGFWQPLQRQATLQRAVPLERWDHVSLYDPEGLPGKSYVNFAAFAEVTASQVAGHIRQLLQAIPSTSKTQPQGHCRLRPV